THSDGRIDPGSSHVPYVLLGNTTGMFTQVGFAGISGFSKYDSFAFPATGDFNGDGLTDLYVIRSDKKLRKAGYGTNNIGSDYIWKTVWTPSGSTGTLSFQEVQIPEADSLKHEYGIVSAGDFNGDGL